MTVLLTGVLEENFPQELKERKQWVLWKLEHDRDKQGNIKLDENGKPKFTKVPKKPDGRNAQSNNPETWSSFSEARTAYMVSDNAFDGYGYVFSADDPYIGFDLDGCIGEDGSFSDLATDLLNSVPGYAEKSPRGRGIHLITRADSPPKSIRENNIEIYGKGQFFTMTGRQLNGHSKIPETPQDVSTLLKKYLGETSSQDIVLSDDAFENYKSPIYDWSSDKIRTQLLNQIDPDIIYGDWVQVGMALHHQYQGSPEGLELFTEWSRGGQKFHEGDCDAKWESFNHKRDSTITLASLIKLYKKTQKEKAKEKAQAPALPLSYAKLTTLKTEDPPPRRWVVDNWIPDASVTAFYGKGGIGKSILCQQLAVAVATGTKFLGQECVKGPVLGYFCEEDNDEILRRAKSIFDELMVDLHDCPELDDLYLAGRAGHQNIFAHYDNDSSHYETEEFSEFKKAVHAIRPKLIILDNISHIFGGNEIYRAMVTSFVNMITRVAKDYDCSVILVGHVAKMKDSEYSGSTAWDAAVRTRLLLNRNKDGTTTFRKAKSNLSKEDELTIELRNTVFRTITPEDENTAKKILAGQIKQFLRDKTKEKIGLSNKPRSHNHIINMMVSEEVIEESKKRLAKEALSEMISNDEILPDADLGWKNSSRHSVKGLKINE